MYPLLFYQKNFIKQIAKQPIEQYHITAPLENILVQFMHSGSHPITIFLLQNNI